MDTTIRIVTDSEEKRAVYRFRYRVYVEEMHREQTYADHARKEIKEPLDATGTLLAAFAGDEVVGALRTNFARHGGLGLYEALYDFGRTGDAFPSSVSMTTKLMVEPAWRRTKVPLELAIAVYRYGLEEDIRFDFIDCNDYLEPFFLRLGYTRTGPNVSHPEYGEVVPMVLDLRDTAHLAAVKSPFAAVLAAHTAASPAPALVVS